MEARVNKNVRNVLRTLCRVNPNIALRDSPAAATVRFFLFGSAEPYSPIFVLLSAMSEG